MADYVVRYEIDIEEVGSPQAAARKLARHLQCDGYAARGVYDVIHQDGTITRIDLSEEDE